MTKPYQTLPGKDGTELVKLPDPICEPHQKIGDLVADFDKLAGRIDDEAAEILAKIYASTHKLIIRHDIVEKAIQQSMNEVRQRVANKFREELIKNSE